MSRSVEFVLAAISIALLVVLGARAFAAPAATKCPSTAKAVLPGAYGIFCTQNACVDGQGRNGTCVLPGAPVNGWVTNLAPVTEWEFKNNAWVKKQVHAAGTVNILTCWCTVTDGAGQVIGVHKSGCCDLVIIEVGQNRRFGTIYGCEAPACANGGQCSPVGNPNLGEDITAECPVQL